MIKKNAHSFEIPRKEDRQGRLHANDAREKPVKGGDRVAVVFRNCFDGKRAPIRRQVCCYILPRFITTSINLYATLTYVGFWCPNES